MPTSKGWKVKAGWKNAVTHGTAVAVGAGDGVYLLTESIRASRPRIDDTSIAGSAQLRGADLTVKSFAGALSTPARYEGRWLSMLAKAMGVAGAPSGSGPYTHTFKIQEDLIQFGTLVLDKQIGANPVWEYDSVYINGVTLRAQAGTGDAARLTVEFEVVARDLARASAINGATQIGNLTFPTAPHLLFHKLTARMNSQAGGALAGPDELKIRSLELSLRNAYRADLYTSNSEVIAQPERGGFAEVTGSLSLDKYTADTPGVTEFLDGTFMKMDLEWNAGTDKIVKLEVPRLQLVDGAGERAISGPDLIANPIPFKGYKPTAAPTGMTATDYFWAFITNNIATDFLA